MASLNRVCLLGNVGGTPEVRATHGGNQVARFSLATSEKWTDKRTGEVKERTEWHRVTVWTEPLIKLLQSYVNKGSKLYVEGKLQTRKWQDQSGQDRYSTEIVLQGFDGKLLLCDRPPAKGGGPEVPESYTPKVRGNDPISSGPANDMDDDIPF